MDIERRAQASLWGGAFADAIDQYSTALALQPSKPAYWEGKAYAHIGQAIGPEFDLGRLWRNEFIERWVARLSEPTGPADVHLYEARLAAEAGFRAASTTGERVAARYLLGLVRELEGFSNYERYDFSPLEHYLKAVKDLKTWEESQEYWEVAAYGSPHSRDYVLPWTLPWQAYQVRALNTYREAIDAAFLRRIAIGGESLEVILEDPTLAEEYEEKLLERVDRAEGPGG